MSQFFDETTPQGQKLTLPQHCARRLANRVRAKRLALNTIDIRRWAQEFEILLRNKDDNNVMLVLNWYLAHLGEPYIPEAYSARSFRKKYEQILRCMDEQPETLVDLTGDGLRVLRQLEGMSWPAGIEQTLPRIVMKSLKAYEEFYAKVIKYQETHLESTRTHQFLMHLKEAFYLCKPRDFVAEWLRRLNDTIMAWQGWSGGAASLVFSERSPWLRKWGQEWSHEYFGTAVYWDLLIKEVSSNEHQSNSHQGKTD